MALKYRSIIRTGKRLKCEREEAEKKDIKLLLPDVTTYSFPHGRGYFKACVDIFNGKRGTSDIEAVMKATSISKHDGQLITLLRMLGNNDDCD